LTQLNYFLLYCFLTEFRGLEIGKKHLKGNGQEETVFSKMRYLLWFLYMLSSSQWQRILYGAQGGTYLGG